MVNENKFIAQSFVPKTYEQFVLEDKQLTPEQEQNLYPELNHEDVGEQKGYGPSGLVSISGPGSSVVKLITAGDASSLIGELSEVKNCAAMHCWTQISDSEYYCSSHKNKVGEGATNVAKSFDETANKEGGLVVVSQRDLGGGSKTTTVDYHSFR